jgi:uncharacterized damage-inducible protein DinB
MKELLQQFGAYHLWASQKILDVINLLPEDKQKAEIPSSFNSLYKTALHMWDAESVWWQRFKMHERILVPSENFKGSMQDVSNGLIAQSQHWKDWLDSATGMALDHVFQYYNTKKELFKQPTWQMILHVFNHGTSHRGQLINMLRQLGIDKLPQTDFIVWSRKK